MTEPPRTMHRWFAVPFQVTGVPGRAEFAVCRAEVDLRVLIRGGGGTGVADERTLRLYRIEGDGREVEQPLQFTPAPQPRAGGGGAPAGASWSSEWSPDAAPPEVRSAGTLTWLAAAGPADVQRYRLVFGMPVEGRVVQLPFPPNNLRCFSSQGWPTPVRHFPRLQVRPQWPLEGYVEVQCDGALLTRYHIGPRADAPEAAAADRRGATPAAGPRRPYFYPVVGPDGVTLTELGKPHDPTGSHAHHYSLWIAHADVGGRDLWSERGGAIVHEAMDDLEDGPLFARLIQRTRWVHGDALVRERRQITAWAPSEGVRLIDLDIELAPAGVAPVVLGKSPFGLLAVRVAQSMTVFDGGGEITNSAGQRNEQGAHGRRAEWIDLSGPVAPGRWAGVAILDHPDNPGHPVFWHCRNDGWAGASLTRQSPLTLTAEQPLRLRYRIVLHRHGALEGDVSRRFEEFAARPQIQVGKAEPVSA